MFGTLAPGTYRLTVSAPGYEPLSDTSGPGADVTKHPGPERCAGWTLEASWSSILTVLNSGAQSCVSGIDQQSSAHVDRAGTDLDNAAMKYLQVVRQVDSARSPRPRLVVRCDYEPAGSRSADRSVRWEVRLRYRTMPVLSQPNGAHSSRTLDCRSHKPLGRSPRDQLRIPWRAVGCGASGGDGLSKNRLTWWAVPVSISSPWDKKGGFRISLSVLVCRSGFCFRRSDVVSAKRPEMRRDALRRRTTELLGQLLGRSCSTAPRIPITRFYGQERPLPNQALRGHLLTAPDRPGADSGAGIDPQGFPDTVTEPPPCRRRGPRDCR